MKQFNSTAILTSKNPEAFLNFVHETTDYLIIPECSIGLKILYVNGLDVNAYSASLGYALQLNAANDLASFNIYTSINSSFDANLVFHFYDSFLNPVPSQDVSISIWNRPFFVSSGVVNTFNNEDILVDDEASYLLMRSNPKFTGNIKLRVNEKNELYLDTFKVSDILSNKKYRKQKVSGNSVLSSDIRNTFQTLPLGELYRVDVDNTLLIGVPKTDYKNQYNTTYNYGAYLIKDELYTEDNALLAPLWINSKLPNYFAIFRLDGVYNQETYDVSSLTNLAFKYFEQSDIVKSWSLRPEAPLGKYLNTHLKDLVKIQAPVFLSLTDPDASIADSNDDPNTWYGIAVDKGVLTGRSETPYFFNQKASNFTDLNAFVSQGFERQSLLIPNIINLEYVFDDNDVSLYSMKRYFGLYLTENILYNIAYYSDSSSGPIQILSLDGNDSSVFMHSSIFDSSGNILSDYANRIFVLNDEVQLKRFKNVNEINETVFNEYVSKPYKNLFTIPVEKVNINPFITLTLNNTLEQGEHLRIINKTQNKIWEIFSVDASQFKCDKYCTISENPGYPTVYRTYFDFNGNISYQIKQIQEAFDLFGEYEGAQFRAGVRGSNWVSLILNDDASTTEEWAFQRITSSTLNNFGDSSSGFNNAAFPGDITFFGRLTPNSSDFEIIPPNSSYGPIDFELYGARQSIKINLFNRGSRNLYSFDSSDNILHKFTNPTLYQGMDMWYRKIQGFNITTQSSSDNYQYVKDPYHIIDRVLVMTDVDILTLKDQWNASSIYPLKISLMGVNPVKDIDYTVYDASLGFQSEYWYARNDDVSSYYIVVDVCSNYIVDIPGSYVIKSGTGIIEKDNSSLSYGPLTLFNTFNSSINLVAASQTLVTYAILDGSFNYKSLNSSTKEENINDYYASNTLLKYGLTIPQVSKWVGLGTDVRNNPLRLILDSSIFDVSTNFIPTSTSFSQEISYSSFKYLGTSGRAWESYVFYDINDVIPDASSFITLKDAMFKYPYVDYFSKLLYSNYNVDATKTRSSIVYYNGYKNTIDTILLGLNLSLKIENVAKSVLDIKNYDRYRFSFMSTTSRNKDNKRPIEVIINENTKTILMIWYQGNDELNYNMRYSSFLPGKALLDPSDNGFISGANQELFSFVKTPYYVNNSTIQKSILKFYDTLATYDSSTARLYAQLNKNLNGFNSAWNAPGANTITGSVFTVNGDSYNTFSQYVDYIYNQNANAFGDYVENYGYNYNSNTNWYVNNTTNIDTLKYFLSSSFNYVMYYILRGDEVYNSYDFGILNPMTITINPPRTYRNMYTYNGWFKPKFNSILDFKSDENAELINAADKDFIFSNTNLRLYNSIPQLWYNKVVTAVSANDISIGNAISYVSNFNVFKALWDADYYFNSQLGSYIDGYESPNELPAFFGSKLVKLPDQLTLENWDITTASFSKTATEITLSFNLSRIILNMFKNNSAFTSNWNGLSNADNIIDSYIRNTIITYYNFSTPKIRVDFYYKPYITQTLFYTYDSNFINDGKQNFNGQLVYENDEYIYRMVVPITGNYSYFAKFTMTEK
jgi:hypothetical protein